MPSFETPGELAALLMEGSFEPNYDNPQETANYLANRIREAARNEVVLSALSGLRRYPEIPSLSLLSAQPLLSKILFAFQSPGFEITATAAGELSCTQKDGNGQVIALGVAAVGEQAAMFLACVEKITEIVQS